MKTKDNIDANKQKFNVEISNKDASSILKNLNDSYELLNDNFIYI